MATEERPSYELRRSDLVPIIGAVRYGSRTAKDFVSYGNDGFKPAIMAKIAAGRMGLLLYTFAVCGAAAAGTFGMIKGLEMLLR